MDLVEVSSHRFARERADLVLAPGEQYLAGGTWLFSEPQPGTAGLVDLSTLGWPAWEDIPSGLRVGATCTVEQLVGLPPELLGTASSLVRQCAEAFLMSFKIQALATVGGNICLALPAGAMISLLSALHADAVIWTPDGGERREPVRELVRGAGHTGLRTGEVIRAVDVDRAALAATYAFRQISLAPMGRSSAVVVGRMGPDGVTFTVTAATSHPVTLRFESLPDAGSLAAAADDIDCWYDDAHGAPDWREAVTLGLLDEVRAELEAGR